MSGTDLHVISKIREKSEIIKNIIEDLKTIKSTVKTDAEPFQLDQAVYLEDAFSLRYEDVSAVETRIDIELIPSICGSYKIGRANHLCPPKIVEKYEYISNLLLNDPMGFMREVLKRTYMILNSLFLATDKAEKQEKYFNHMSLVNNIYEKYFGDVISLEPRDLEDVEILAKTITEIEETGQAIAKALKEGDYYYEDAHACHYVQGLYLCIAKYSIKEIDVEIIDTTGQTVLKLNCDDEDKKDLGIYVFNVDKIWLASQILKKLLKNMPSVLLTRDKDELKQLLMNLPHQ